MKTNTISVYLLSLMCLGAMVSDAHNSYTGGYSGAPGSNGICSSCHTTFVGTITVSGFPTAYVPGQIYTITVGHTGGSKIINFNATTRIGTGTAVAGSFTAGTATALFTGSDGGVYVPSASHLTDLATFQWTAPAAGTGAVNFYLAGMQGTSTGSSSGQSTRVTLTATETTTGVEPITIPKTTMVLANYPNPFNPATTVLFSIPANASVKISVFDLSGKKIRTLFDGYAQAGRQYQIQFDASLLTSGIYLCSLDAAGDRIVRRMIVLK
jgi:hypothetical protein